MASDFRSEVEIRPFRACAMHPAIIIGTVRSLWTMGQIPRSTERISGFHKRSKSAKFERSAFEKAARYPNSETKLQCCDDRPMSWPSLVNGSTYLWESSVEKNNCMRKRTKSSITQPWFIRFHSNCVQSLNAWHPKCFESSRSRGQRSRLGLVITCAKMCNIISNTTGHC